VPAVWPGRDLHGRECRADACLHEKRPRAGGGARAILSLGPDQNGSGAPFTVTAPPGRMATSDRR
jgi:hypothetical protein